MKRPSAMAAFAAVATVAGGLMFGQSAEAQTKAAPRATPVSSVTGNTDPTLPGIFDQRGRDIFLFVANAMARKAPDRVHADRIADVAGSIGNLTGHVLSFVEEQTPRGMRPQVCLKYKDASMVAGFAAKQVNTWRTSPVYAQLFANALDEVSRQFPDAREKMQKIERDGTAAMNYQRDPSTPLPPGC